MILGAYLMALTWTYQLNSVRCVHYFLFLFIVFIERYIICNEFNAQRKLII